MKKYKLLFFAFIFFEFIHAQTNMGDVNGDGTLSIMIIGTTQSINSNSEEFSPYQIAIELQNILLLDTSITIGVNVVAEDIYRTKNVSTGIANQITSNLDYLLSFFISILFLA